MELKNIAVIGPSGIVGKAVIQELQKDPTFNVSAVHRTSYSPPPNAPIHVTGADFNDQPSITRALQNQDAVICCVPGGATQLAMQKPLIDGAIDAGVKLFFASEFISDILSPHFAVFPTQFVGEKIKVRQYLQQKADAGEISWTALNGGPMFDLWLSKGFAGFDITSRKGRIYGTGNNLSCWTPVPVIAAAVVNMLRNPKPILNRSIFVSGVEGLTQNTILAALEAEIGEKFQLEYIDLKPIKEKALEDLEKENYAQASKGLAINANFNEFDSSANFWDKVENDLVGVKSVSVREAVKTVLDSMRSTK